MTTPLDVEELADAVAERVLERLIAHGIAPRQRIVDAQGLGQLLGVSRDWVYAHATDLGVMRLPAKRGARTQLRFDVDAVLRGLADARSPSRKKAVSPADRSPAAALIHYDRR